MTTRDLNQTELLQLETLVNSAGIEAVLRGLSELAHQQAERARCDWVNKPLAKRWTTLAVAVGGLAPTALGL
jgi:hypothetical protein